MEEFKRELNAWHGRFGDLQNGIAYRLAMGVQPNKGYYEDLLESLEGLAAQVRRRLPSDGA